MIVTGHSVVLVLNKMVLVLVIESLVANEQERGRTARRSVPATFVGWLFAGRFILKKWKLPLSWLAVVRYSDNCGWAKGDPELYEEFAKKMIS